MLSSSRIALQGLTPFPHEAEALEFVKKELPDVDPFRIWALFDLVDLSGRRYEIDLLVLGYEALYHVEIKGHPGRVSGDVVDWTFTFPDSGVSVRENPLRLAEHKSRVLGSLLERQMGSSRPYVETLILLSHPDVRVDLQGAARTNIVTRSQFGRAIQFGEFPGASPRRRARIDRPTAKATADALKAIGVRASKGSLRVGAYLLDGLVEEGAGYQDRLAHNERIPDMRRRARSYLVPQSPTAERREQLRRAAEREARILTAIGDHPAILKMTDYEADGPTGGPCILFEHLDDARTLDAFLRQNPKLPFEQRLQIVEQVADALSYCHRKKVLHRGISPSSVLVRARPEGKGLETKLYNFQLATRTDGSHGTMHLSQLGPEPYLVYRAPEVIEDPSKAREESDIFSLGALAYFVFTGRHPGTTLAERQTLFEAGGGHLSLAAVDDALAPGAVPTDGLETAQRRTLEQIIGYATEQNALERPNSAIEWMQLLLEEVTAPQAPPTSVAPEADPLEARPGQLLHGYEVVKVLGTGATARVVRVLKDGSTYALKISRAPEFDERLKAEAQALQKLRGDRIVNYEATLNVGGRVCLLLEDAGETLADILAKDGAQSLDYARRWGEDLLLALRSLESRHVLHRDIKPANLGVPTSQAKRTRNLFLFDFSLAGLDPREVTVGTPAYRDPFVVTRGQWDEAADRFSAAITLYEVLTGVRPSWGTGDVAATATDAQMVIEAERFDPTIRERLLAFFAKAFSRDLQGRHDSAETMRTDWLETFMARSAPKDIDEPQAEPSQQIDYAALTDMTPVHAIQGLSVRAKNALDRSGVITVRDVLSLPTNKLSAIRGVGRDTAREILALLRGLKTARPAAAPGAPLHPDFIPFHPDFRGEDLPTSELPGLSAAAVVALRTAGLERATEVAVVPKERLERILARVPQGLVQVEKALANAKAVERRTEPVSVEDWVHHLFPTSGKRHQYVRELFCLDEGPGGGYATTTTDLARRHGIQQPNVSIAVSQARETWSKDPLFSGLAAIVTSILTTHGGVGAIQRIAQVLLDTLPHEDGDPARRGAAALVRAVGEVGESFSLGRIGDGLWIGSTVDAISIAKALGEEADRLCTREPLPSFEQSRAALELLTAKTVLAGLPGERIVMVAAEASTKAAASARLELYPVGMDAERSLRLSAGALSSARLLPAQVRRTVHLRYPAAVPLPADDEALARLVKPLGLELRDGMFERPGAVGPTSSLTEGPSTRKPTVIGPPRPTADPRQQQKREFVGRVLLAARNRSFRVLEVAAAYAETAERELARVLKIQPVSLEREILRSLDDVLRDQEIDASIVVEADRAGPDHPESWSMLCDVVGDAAKRAIERIAATNNTVLLTQPGILARYGLQEPLHALRRATERDDGPGVFLLVPAYSDASAAVVIDAPTGPLSVPTSSPAQRLSVPDVWIINE